MTYEPKKLEWEVSGNWHSAVTPFCKYTVPADGSVIFRDGWDVAHPIGGEGPPKSLEQAKRLCQQDYDHRWKKRGVKSGAVAALVKAAEECLSIVCAERHADDLADLNTALTPFRVTVKENQTEGDDE